jgi:glycerol-3-phosphate dehydrogenase (NAD(P)+)
MTSNFRVLGAGVWGLAFSDHLLKLGHNVEVFCRDTNLSNKDITGLELSQISENNIKSLDNLNTQKSNGEINIIAVNSKGFSELLDKHKGYFSKLDKLVSLTKGLNHLSGKYFSDYVFDMFKNINKYGLISGPSFAKDLCNEKKMSVSFASLDEELSTSMVKATKSSYFEMIPTTYIYHIEIAGIIKNIAAILCGMADKYHSKGVHSNAIIKKACQETWQKGVEAFNRNDDPIDILNKDRDSIITSPGCIGDMILTCKQEQSRNYQFGKLIADTDVSIEDAKSIVGTVEGYDCCITLIEKTQSTEGELTNLLYKIIKSQNKQREKLLRDFLQA